MLLLFALEKRTKKYCSHVFFNDVTDTTFMKNYIYLSEQLLHVIVTRFMSI